MVGKETVKRGTSVLLVVVALMVVIMIATSTSALAAPSQDKCSEKVDKVIQTGKGNIPKSCGLIEL